MVGVVWKFPMNNIVSLKIQKYFWIKRVFVPEMAWPIQNIAFELCSFEERKKNTCSFFLWKKTKILRADTHNYAAKSMERMRKVFVDLITNCLVSSSDIEIGIVVAVVVEVKIVSHCYYYYHRKVFLDLITNCYTSSTADRPL